MSDHVFDAIARQAASGMSRRTSLFALGALGLTAMAGPISADAKKNRKKNKNKNKNKNDGTEEDDATRQANEQCLADLTACTAEEQRCADQVESCTSFLTANCGGDPRCTFQATCCSFLGTCDMSGFLACLSRPPSAPR